MNGPVVTLDLDGKANEVDVARALANEAERIAVEAVELGSPVLLPSEKDALDHKVGRLLCLANDLHFAATRESLWASPQGQRINALRRTLRNLPEPEVPTRTFESKWLRVPGWRDEHEGSDWDWDVRDERSLYIAFETLLGPEDVSRVAAQIRKGLIK